MFSFWFAHAFAIWTVSGNSSSLLHVASARKAPWGGRIHIQGGLCHRLQRGGLIGWELSRSCWLGTQFTSIEPSTELLLTAVHGGSQGWSDFWQGHWLLPEHRVEADECHKEAQNCPSVCFAAYWLKPVRGQFKFKGKGKQKGVSTRRCDSSRTTRVTAHQSPISRTERIKCTPELTVLSKSRVTCSSWKVGQWSSQSLRAQPNGWSPIAHQQGDPRHIVTPWAPQSPYL